MKTEITSRNEADRVINQFGKNLMKIMALQDTNKSLKAAFEKWANTNPELAFDAGKKRGETESFAFTMVMGERALKVQSHLTREEVVARLQADEVMKEYTLPDFNSDAIKSDFGSSESKRRAVEDFGLYFTNPKPHLVVEAL